MLGEEPVLIGACMRVQVQAPPPMPAATPAAATDKEKKARERQRMESNVEKEIDRLIDSQDNVYVLSRPKCALALHLGSFLPYMACQDVP